MKTVNSLSRGKNINMKIKLSRIAMAPFAFLYGVFMVYGGIIFPSTLIIILSIGGFLISPFVWLFNKSGAHLKYVDPLFDITRYSMVNHFLGMTILIWVPFWVAYGYVLTGKLYLTD